MLFLVKLKRYFNVMFPFSGGDGGRVYCGNAPLPRANHQTEREWDDEKRMSRKSGMRETK